MRTRVGCAQVDNKTAGRIFNKVGKGGIYQVKTLKMQCDDCFFTLKLRLSAGLFPDPRQKPVIFLVGVNGSLFIHAPNLQFSLVFSERLQASLELDA